LLEIFKPFVFLQHGLFLKQDKISATVEKKYVEFL